MKKHFLFYILCFALFSIPSQIKAQESPTEEVLSAEVAGNVMCDCINAFLDDLHPQIKLLIRNIEANGIEDAQAKFATYIEEHPEESEQIMKDAQKMQNFEKTILQIDGCEEFNNLMSDKNIEEQPNFEEDMIDYLKSKTKCEYAYIFYKLGNK